MAERLKQQNNLEPETPESDLQQTNTGEKGLPRRRTRERFALVALEALRRRFYESREKRRLKRELRKEKKRLAKIKERERQRRKIGNAILEETKEKV